MARSLSFWYESDQNILRFRRFMWWAGGNWLSVQLFLSAFSWDVGTNNVLILISYEWRVASMPSLVTCLAPSMCTWILKVLSRLESAKVIKVWEYYGTNNSIINSSHTSMLVFHVSTIQQCHLNYSGKRIFSHDRLEKMVRFG